MKLTEVPELPEVDANAAQDFLYGALAILIGTAIIVIGWRMLNGTAKMFIIAIALIFFVVYAVIPNWN